MGSAEVTALLLSPHYDDETLFAAYTVIRNAPWVVTCMGEAHVQEKRGGPSKETRATESAQALSLLGASGWDILPVQEEAPDAEMLAALLTDLRDREPWDVVYAPAVEDGGHDHHNLVGEVALDVFGGDVMAYLTYRRGHGRSTSQYPVMPEPGWRAIKAMAMACYSSQIELDDCLPWWSDWAGEWMA